MGRGGITRITMEVCCGQLCGLSPYGAYAVGPSPSLKMVTIRGILSNGESRSCGYGVLYIMITVGRICL